MEIAKQFQPQRFDGQGIERAHKNRHADAEAGKQEPGPYIPEPLRAPETWDGGIAAAVRSAP